VEFAIVLPVLLLIVVAALDFGRAFMGWVVLNNAARVGANYAALHPAAWGPPGSSEQQTAYADLVEDAREDAGIVLDGCDQAAVPDPSFPNGDSIGDYAVLELICDFRPITPLIGDVLTGGSGPLAVSARAVFPIRQGVIDTPPEPPTQVCTADFTYEVDPDDPLTINFTNTTVGGDGSYLWDFGDATAEQTRDATNTYNAEGTYQVVLYVGGCTPFAYPGGVVVGDGAPPDPGSDCIVPVFLDTKRNDADETWSANGFSLAVVYQPDPPGNWTIEDQSLVGGSTQPCNAPITLSPESAP
jgi:hypothetical protein